MEKVTAKKKQKRLNVKINVTKLGLLVCIKLRLLKLHFHAMIMWQKKADLRTLIYVRKGCEKSMKSNRNSLKNLKHTGVV